MDKATFAAGCFWGVEHFFREVPGVASAISGYTGGQIANPSYRQVCSGLTNHAEAIEIVFDPVKVDYQRLVDLFFKMHDPTTLNRQGPDVGTQYRSAIFAHSPQQAQAAKAAIARLSAGGTFPQPVVTVVEDAGVFWPAEDYHQRYFEKNGGSCHVTYAEVAQP